MAEFSKYPKTRDILYLLGVGTLLAGTILLPGLGYIAREIYKSRAASGWKRSHQAWERFNPKYLKRNLKRLHEQKLVEIVNQDGYEVIKLTQKGKTKFLKFKLEEISLTNQSWDGKWRVVFYDISTLKKHSQENFRRLLKQMSFYPLQKSVYITPFKCQQEIEYVKQYFNLDDEVLLVEAGKLENEQLYRQYFGV